MNRRRADSDDHTPDQPRDGSADGEAAEAHASRPDQLGKVTALRLDQLTGADDDPRVWGESAGPGGMSSSGSERAHEDWLREQRPPHW